MKNLCVSALLLLFSIGISDAHKYEFFNAEKPKVLTADLNQPIIRSMFTRSLNGYFKHKCFWDIGMGGALPLLSITNDSEKLVSVNVLGDIKSRFIVGAHSFDLLNSDYTGGLNLLMKKAFSLPGDTEVSLIHTSSHLGDEVTIDSATYRYSRINYSREIIKALYHQSLPRNATHTFGAHYIIRKDPEIPHGRLALQYDISVPFKFMGGSLFANSDIQCNQEHNWNADVSLQISLRLGRETGQIFSQKLTLEFYDGYSRQGQFYDKRERYISLGIIAHI